MSNDGWESPVARNNAPPSSSFGNESKGDSNWGEDYSTTRVFTRGRANQSRGGNYRGSDDRPPGRDNYRGRGFGNGSGRGFGNGSGRGFGNGSGRGRYGGRGDDAPSGEAEDSSWGDVSSHRENRNWRQDRSDDRSGDRGGRRQNWRDDRGGGGRHRQEGETDNVEVPSSMVGKIIGRGGSKISELQEESGARINVTKEVNGGNTIVRIMGSAECIEKAKSLIDEVVNSRPYDNHF